MVEHNYWNDAVVYEYDEAAYKESETAYEEEWLHYAEEWLGHEEEPYPLLTGFDEYKTNNWSASTLDGYLMALVKGFINVDIRSELDQHIMELLEDEWFYQWPLVHWAYASRLLHGVGCRKSKKNRKRAVDLLLPMARNGCPGALYDIGCCYMKGEQIEQSYVKAIYCWTMASGKGYLKANPAISDEYWTGSYAYHEAEIPVTLKYAFLCANIKIFIKDRGITESNITQKLNTQGRKDFRKLCNEWKRLEKEIVAKAPLLMSASLFWDDENNPYKITI